MTLYHYISGRHAQAGIVYEDASHHVGVIKAASQGISSTISGAYAGRHDLTTFCEGRMAKGFRSAAPVLPSPARLKWHIVAAVRAGPGKPGGHLGEGKTRSGCDVGALFPEARVKRTAVCAIKGSSPHRLLRVLAAVLLLVRAIQPVSHVGRPCNRPSCWPRPPGARGRGRHSPSRRTRRSRPGPSGLPLLPFRRYCAATSISSGLRPSSRAHHRRMAGDGAADRPGAAFSRLPPAPRSSSARLTPYETQATAAQWMRRAAAHGIRSPRWRRGKK